ncbi:hypothetical protein KPH14_004570 [Odynerus spinipes]|uniref:Ribosomal protein S14 n=1 Tax=Odynerus spinipes TaxID=1348599 RepID=A0AAD9RN51_9HYME|nr:hypothetical protein KPH14_004570 [Odynerus spinipes]
MAALMSSISTFCNVLSKSSKALGCDLQQIRNYYGFRMRRDAKRRVLAGQYAPERLRLVALKRNDILPVEVRELAGKQIDETIPRQSALRQLTFRCIVTSRPRGIVYRWRLSRIVFRDLADYNKLAGVQRAMCFKPSKLVYMMNDSFLEDLDLLPSEKRSPLGNQAERHITIRHTTSSPLQRSVEQDDFEKLVQQQKAEGVSTKISRLPQIKEPGRRDSPIKDVRTLTEHDTRKQKVKAMPSDRKEKGAENKLKSMENKVKSDSREKDNKQETKVKISENKIIIKDHNRRSGSYKENARSLDTSSKENSRPPDSSKGSTLQVDVTKERGRVTESSTRKSETKEYDPVALLNAIKDLISTYTKQESTKLLRAMQEFHLNSQATFIKNILSQTDEIVKEIHPSRESTRMRELVEENEKLREDIIILQKRSILGILPDTLLLLCNKWSKRVLY